MLLQEVQRNQSICQVLEYSCMQVAKLHYKSTTVWWSKQTPTCINQCSNLGNSWQHPGYHPILWIKSRSPSRGKGNPDHHLITCTYIRAHGNVNTPTTSAASAPSLRSGLGSKQTLHGRAHNMCTSLNMCPRKEAEQTSKWAWVGPY
jgi:hypothetical protein